MIDQELLRERYDYHPDGYLIAKRYLGPRSTKGSIVGGKIGRGYYVTRIEGKVYYIHRLIYMWHHGYISDVIDHINNDKTDNRIENLRDVTQYLNSLNRIDRAPKTCKDPQRDAKTSKGAICTHMCVCRNDSILYLN